MAAPRVFHFSLKDTRGGVLDDTCDVTVGPEGLSLSGGAAASALGALGWRVLLRVRSCCAPARLARPVLRVAATRSCAAAVTLRPPARCCARGRAVDARKPHFRLAARCTSLHA
jgi:hypothetical protein